MKTSYVHVQTAGKRLGFSAKIDCSEDVDDNGRKVCDLSFTFCNPKDKHFCKKKARAALDDAISVEVRCIDVPQYLADAEDYCYGHTGRAPAHIVSRYNYVLKRFL